MTRPSMAPSDSMDDITKHPETILEKQKQTFQTNGIDTETLQNLEFYDGFETKQPQWKPSVKPIDSGNGYEIPWKSARTPVSGAGLSHVENNATPMTAPEWKPSVRCFKPKSGTYGDHWKSKVVNSHPRYSEFYKWKSCIRLFEQKESIESTKSKGRRYIPCRPHTAPSSWLPHRAFVSTKPQPKWVPPFRSIDPGVQVTKSLRQRVASYFKMHPRIQLSSNEGPENPSSGASEPSTGLIASERKPLRKRVNNYYGSHPQLQLFPSGLPEPPGMKTADSSPKRRYIPEGHLDRFEIDGNCITEQNNVLPMTECSRWSVASREFQTVTQRNVITGLLNDTDVIPPTKNAVVPALLSPAGSFNKYVIENRFSVEETRGDTDDNQCSSDQLIESFSRNNQACGIYRRRQASVDAALTEHLYEVKQTMCA